VSRSGYSDGCEGWDLIRWRGAVESAIRGKRGQAFLKELLAALDALPEKKLVANELVTLQGQVCILTTRLTHILIRLLMNDVLKLFVTGL
jgi:hypothetical protein